MHTEEKWLKCVIRYSVFILCFYTCRNEPSFRVFFLFFVSLHITDSLWRTLWTDVIAAALGTTLAFGLVLFLPLHATILEPDFDLPFGQAESVGYFYASSSRQVPIEVKFLLQLQRLVSCIRLPASLPL